METQARRLDRWANLSTIWGGGRKIVVPLLAYDDHRYPRGLVSKAFS
jgi:hypothetical protein